jgi:hypothetical protein
MIDCYRLRASYYVVRCEQCLVESIHPGPDAAERTGLAHEARHDMAEGLNRYFGLCGASIELDRANLAPIYPN